MAPLRLMPSFGLARFEVFDNSKKRLFLLGQQANKFKPELLSTCPFHGCLLDPHGPIKIRYIEAQLESGACRNTQVAFDLTSSL